MRVSLLIKILCATLLIHSATLAGVDEKEVSTPRFLFNIPENRVCLIAIDRDPEANRKYLNKKNIQPVKGVDPVSGDFFVKPAEVFVSLEYPEKRKTPQDRAPMWVVNTGWSISEKTSLNSKGEFVSISGEINSKLSMSFGYNFSMANRVQKVAYRENGRINWGYEIQITESPVKPKVERVETGIPGIELFQIPYGKVGGKTQCIIVLVSESLAAAESAIYVSDENSKFQWTKRWFSETPASTEAAE